LSTVRAASFRKLPIMLGSLSRRSIWRMIFAMQPISEERMFGLLLNSKKRTKHSTLRNTSTVIHTAGVPINQFFTIRSIAGLSKQRPLRSSSSRSIKLLTGNPKLPVADGSAIGLKTWLTGTFRVRGIGAHRFLSGEAKTKKKKFASDLYRN